MGRRTKSSLYASAKGAGLFSACFLAVTTSQVPGRETPDSFEACPVRNVPRRLE
jgi:hypothetical protein